jgi:hypothetical protein
VKEIDSHWTCSETVPAIQRARFKKLRGEKVTARSYQQLLLVVVLPALLCNSVFAIELKTPTEAIPNTYFGLHIHHLAWPTPTPWPSMPVPTWRLWDADVRWIELEPNQGQWQFERLDHFVALAEQHGTSLLLPLGVSPQWAVGPYLSNNSPPQSLDLWRTYVKTVVSRYKGRIKAYEIWNEPNLRDFWAGTMEQMVTLTKEAFQIIHAVDPDAIVVSPSATADFGIPWFEEFLKKGGGQYVDVIGYHFYVAKLPEELVPLIQRVRQVIAENKLADKPLWNTEQGWIAAARPDSEELAGGILARAYILAWAAGVQRFYWYAWDNQLMGIVTYNEGEHRVTAAGHAYEIMQQWLVGAHMNNCEKSADDDWVCQLSRAGKKQWLVWNPQRNHKFDVPRAWRVQNVTPLFHDKRLLNGPSVDIGPVPELLTGRS